MRDLILFFSYSYFESFVNRERNFKIRATRIALARSLYIRDALHILVFCESKAGLYCLVCNVDRKNHTQEFKRRKIEINRYVILFCSREFKDVWPLWCFPLVQCE